MVKSTGGPQNAQPSPTIMRGATVALAVALVASKGALVLGSRWS